MSVLDIERLIKEAQTGNFRATMTLYTRAKRLDDSDLFDLVTGIRKAKLKELESETRLWEEFVTQRTVGIKINGYGNKKIYAIKAVRTLLTGLGLKEAKYICDTYPRIIPMGFTDNDTVTAAVNQLKTQCSTIELEIVVYPEDYDAMFKTTMDSHFDNRGY